MKTLKRYLQTIFLFLLKKLNMPKPFSEFTTAHLSEIHNRLDIYTGPYATVRMDKNMQYAVLEYKEQTDRNAMFSSNSMNHPDITVNISKDFQIVLKGFTPNDEPFVLASVKKYLSSRGFL